ncbi:hypothetical protein CRENBAI_007890 [Crenichthys baileyi]|uniref:Uncharacterized protein n=1 Tax=Crenichthys baileyi TaxID=28760 RepID=A0AAV9R796_9TELE
MAISKQGQPPTPIPEENPQYTHHNIQTTPRTHKTLDTQTLCPAKRMHSFKERAPDMRWSTNELKAPGARAGLQGMHGLRTLATYPPEPKLTKPTPDLPRSSTATRPVTYVRWHRPPKSTTCSHQMSPLRATKTPPLWEP